MEPLLSFDGIILRPQALPIRPDWGCIFGRSAPLALEIGIGNGEFIVWLALQFPEMNCIGVEIDRDYLLKARNRVRAQGTLNVRLVPMEGSKALSRLFAPNSLSALYLNFPDPWHKRRHQKRRLVNDAFAWLVASRLVVGGQFLMVTDYEPYAQEVVAAFSGCPAYAPLWETPTRTDLPDYYPTKYARKWAALGRSFVYIGFRKVQPIELPEWVLQVYPLAALRGDEPMPQVLLRVHQPVDWQQLWHNLPVGLLWQQGSNVVNVKGCYLGGDSLVVDLVVTEGRLMQRFFAVVRSHPNGVLIRPHDASHPDPTPGVHRSIALLSQAILLLLPGASVHQTTCDPRIWKEVFADTAQPGVDPKPPGAPL